MRVLYVYKYNPQDPTEIAIRRWLRPVFGSENVETFTFLPQEKKRGSENPDSPPNERLMEVARRFRPTHIFNWVPYFNRAEMEEFRKLGIKVTACINGVTSLSTGLFLDQAAYFEILRMHDFYLIPHFPHVEPLRKLGMRAVKFPFCFDPDVYKPAPFARTFGAMAGLKAAFVGNFGPSPLPQGLYRSSLVRAVAETGKVLLICDRRYREYGLGKISSIKRLPTIERQSALNWAINAAPFSLGADYYPDVDVYNRGLLNVSMNYVLERDNFTMRPRTMWSMGAGSIAVVERFPDMEHLFEDGREIILWSSFTEARDRISEVAANSPRMRKIAEAARSKVMSKHTAEIRLGELKLLWETGKFPEY